jgi:hypothetical protein
MTNHNRHSSQADVGHKIADLVSTFVSPPTIAIVATIAFSLWSPIGLGTLSAPVSILLCFLLFAFFPFLPVVYYYRKNVIDLYVSEREARTPFYLVALASYATALILFFVTETKILFLLALGYTVVTAILMVVNFFWKVSTHCAGVSGPIVALIFVFGVNILPECCRNTDFFDSWNSGIQPAVPLSERSFESRLLIYSIFRYTSQTKISIILSRHIR